jgi:hypothetical protein
MIEIDRVLKDSFRQDLPMLRDDYEASSSLWPMINIFGSAKAQLLRKDSRCKIGNLPSNLIPIILGFADMTLEKQKALAEIINDVVEKYGNELVKSSNFLKMFSTDIINPELLNGFSFTDNGRIVYKDDTAGWGNLLEVFKGEDFFCFNSLTCRFNETCRSKRVN